MWIHGNFIHTPTLGALDVQPDAWLEVGEDGRTVGFRPGPPPAGAPRQDWGDALILPAFVDLHLHAPQILNRGMGYDMQLLPWLEQHTFPTEARFADEELARLVWKDFLNRLWAVGTLRFSAFATVHAQSAWALMELTQRAGLRAFIGKVNMDRNAPDSLLEDTRTSLAETEMLICRCREELDGVEYILTPRFVPSVTEGMMEGLGRLAEQYQLPVQSHLSENRDELALVARLHPDIPTYTQVYQHYGLLPEGRTIMAHAIHLSEGERALLLERQVMLAHCPLSNTNLSSGVMPLRRSLTQGQRCCVASDVAGGHTAAMNRSVAAAVGVSKLRAMVHPDEPALTLPETLYLATRSPGAFFGQVGAFLPGYEFDALVIRPQPLDRQLGYTPSQRLERFLYDGDDRDILARYCAGRSIPRPFPELD